MIAPSAAPLFASAEMQAKGTAPEELKKLIQQRYKNHYYKPPERAGVSYIRTLARQLQRQNNSITSRSMGAGPRLRIPFSYCMALMDT